jgi:hypothetical protein
MLANQDLPSKKTAKGFLDRDHYHKVLQRIFGQKCPSHKDANKDANKDARSFETHRAAATAKQLFAFRLDHFENMIEDIKGLSISDRVLELMKPEILSYYKYRMTHHDGKIFNEVLAALSSFVKERSQRRG